MPEVEACDWRFVVNKHAGIKGTSDAGALDFDPLNNIASETHAMKVIRGSIECFVYCRSIPSRGGKISDCARSGRDLALGSRVSNGIQKNDVVQSRQWCGIRWSPDADLAIHPASDVPCDECTIQMNRLVAPALDVVRKIRAVSSRKRFPGSRGNVYPQYVPRCAFILCARWWGWSLSGNRSDEKQGRNQQGEGFHSATSPSNSLQYIACGGVSVAICADLD
jgi:hypothetical protein